MSNWTNTREAIQSTAQKAGDTYALVRKLEEQVRGQGARIGVLEAQLDEALSRLDSLEPTPVVAAPVMRPRRKAA